MYPDTLGHVPNDFHTVHLPFVHAYKYTAIVVSTQKWEKEEC